MKLSVILLLSALFVLTGCRLTTAPTTVEKHDSEYEVVVNSLLFHSHFRVMEKNVRRTNGLLEANVKGLNVSGKDVQCEYRYVWLDKDGARIDTQNTVWKQLSLHARETAMMSGLCPSPDAVNFLLAIRFVFQSKRW